MNKHEWFMASFVYGEWVECTCGYRPQSQEDMDVHGVMALADEIGQKIDAGQLPPQDENGFYIL